MDRLPLVIRSIPRHCFNKEASKSWWYLARDVVAFVILAALIVSIHSLLLKLVLSIILGCVVTGLFVIGHDAGHRSFSDSKLVNNFVGHLCCSFSLWPFHVWRLSHDHHHKWTHHVNHDVAWKPLTVEEFNQLSQIKRYGYYFSRYFFFFWASMLFQYFTVDDALKGRFFAKSDRDIIARSLVVTLVIGASYATAAVLLGGWSGFVFLFLIPQLVYQFWLSFFTLFHHTSPDESFMTSETWDPVKAQLGSSIHVDYPPLVDWFTHDIGWHVPHHVCTSIPHYHLRDAHKALKSKYHEIVQEKRLNPSLVWNVISQCHLIDQAESSPVKWVRINFFEDLVGSKARKAKSMS